MAGLIVLGCTAIVLLVVLIAAVYVGSQVGDALGHLIPVTLR